jgi:chromosome segregation ATPase
MASSVPLIERRLSELGDELRRLREELRVTEAELDHFAGEADDARLRAVVSEHREAERHDRDAQRQVAAITRQRNHLRAEIDRLEQAQDALLDELTAAMRANDR